jgi:hypothetical protein
MKKAATSIAFIFCAFLALASGPSPRRIQVIDSTSGEALSAVRVVIQGYSESVFTDENGFFELQAPSEGELEVELSMVSYKPCKTRLTVGSEENGGMKISLSPR